MKKKWFAGQGILEYIIIFAVVIFVSIKFYPKVKTMFDTYKNNAYNVIERTH